MRELLGVLDAFRSRITEGTYPLGSTLPPQRELAEEFEVSRDTVQRALRELRSDGWIESRQGSGSRVIRASRSTGSSRCTARGRALSLGEFIGRAFEQPEVTLDVFTFTAESLDLHLRLQAERIRGGLMAPERIALRVLLPSEEVSLPYPRARDDPDDPRLQWRLREIKGRHLASLRHALRDLRAEALVPFVSLEVRHTLLTPVFKLYLLSGTEALFAPYEVVQRQVCLDDGNEIEAIDVLGLGAPLTFHISDGDPDSEGSAFVASMQSWFDSVWNLLSK
ncbi:GntR family transcriptional regulator [Streptomyces sp. NPDC050564]|uniref:GntR family transcriptional regulator n=1 Tax=Streptomyces sp. NPDC050564 TaxID=3365631 RepID=UPI0037B05E91